MNTATQTQKLFKARYVNPNLKNPENTPQSRQMELPVIKKTTPVSLQVADGVKDVKPQSKSTSILEFLLEMRYADLERVAKKFYKSPIAIDTMTAKNQFGDLISQGLLATKKGKNSEVEIYVVTDAGREFLLKEKPEKKYAQATKQIFWPRMVHDMLLLDLRIRFEELNFVNKWYSEAMLKEVPLFLREFSDLPDAVVKKKNDKGYFLELEVSMKSPKVYAERIAQYLQILQKEEIKDASIEGVIFVSDPSCLVVS